MNFLNKPYNLRKEIEIQNIYKFFDFRHIFNTFRHNNIKDMNIDAFINTLIKKMSLILLQPGDVLFRINDPGDVFFLIFKGKVSLEIPKEDKFIITQKEYYERLENLYNKRDFVLIKYTIAKNKGKNSFKSFSEFIDYKILCLRKYFRLLINTQNIFMRN
jgi:hypothetical protein